MDEEAADVIAEGLHCNTGVLKLTLRYIRGDNVICILLNGLINNSALISLELFSGDMGMEEVMALQEVLIENKTLREMTLDSMESGEEVSTVQEGIGGRTFKLTVRWSGWDDFGDLDHEMTIEQ